HVLYVLLLFGAVPHRHLPSFPTRRSSDLVLSVPHPQRHGRCAVGVGLGPGEAGLVVVEGTGKGDEFGLRDPGGRTRHPCPYLLRSEEHTSELQSQSNLVCRLLLEKKKKKV